MGEHAYLVVATSRATPEQVFDLLADAPRWREWAGSSIRCTVELAPVRGGTEIRWFGRFTAPRLLAGPLRAMLNRTLSAALTSSAVHPSTSRSTTTVRCRSGSSSSAARTVVQRSPAMTRCSGPGSDGSWTGASSGRAIQRLTRVKTPVTTFGRGGRGVW